MKKIMAVNCGSSSLKFKLYDMPEEIVLTSGIVERIGHEDAIFQIKFGDNKIKNILSVKDHAQAVKIVLDALIENKIISDYSEISATGHRIVQGGSYFNKSAIFDEEAAKIIESLIPLAPLHNKAHLVGYNAFKEVIPNAPAVAVFDTAFHQTMEPEDYVFPIPYEYTEKYMIRRYGAHGTSHKYLSERAEKYIDTKDKKLIICHLGSGASITATKNGKCVATTMGLTPLGGIMMGTRTGDMDPSVFYQLMAMTGKGFEELFQEFNKKSGLLGVSGVSNDSRDVEAARLNGNKRAELAEELWTRRIADFIGQYFVRLGGCDAIVFSAGVGENSPRLRELIINKISEALNLKLDEERNNFARGKEALISADDSAIKLIAIPTDEEVMIARDTYALTNK